MPKQKLYLLSSQGLLELRRGILRPLQGPAASTPAVGPASSIMSYTNPLEAVFATPELSYLQYGILASGLEGILETRFPIWTKWPIAVRNLGVCEAIQTLKTTLRFAYSAGSFVAQNTSYTILAPNNGAFNRSPVNFLTGQRLPGIIAFHIIPVAMLVSKYYVYSGLILLEDPVWFLKRGASSSIW